MRDISIRAGLWSREKKPNWGKICGIVYLNRLMAGRVVGHPMHSTNLRNAHSKIRIIHIANLKLTLQRFVEPLSTNSINGEFEHLHVHADSSESHLESALTLSFGRSKLGIFMAWIDARKNARLLASGDPDIVHIHTPAAALALFPSLLKIKKTGAKVVYTARGSFDEGGGVARKVLWRFLDPLKWRVWDGVCVTNDHLLEIADTRPQRVRKKVSVGAAIPNWDATFQSDGHTVRSVNGNPLRLAWVGRLSKDKRLQDFIKLVTELDESLPRGCVGEVIGASLEGDGKEVHLPPSDNIVFHGWVDSPIEIIALCDALISTSIREGYGLAPLEAALVGTPTIAVANHGTRESVPRVGGLLVRPLRPSELFNAVRAFSETAPEWKIGNRARVQKLAMTLIEESHPKAEMTEFYREVALG